MLLESERRAFNVLFSSVGRRVELIKAFRQAYHDLELNGKILAMDVDRLAPALRVVDRAYIVPRLDSKDYIPALKEICKKEKVNVIFPLIDPDIPVLAKNSEEIEATGARLAVVSRESAAIASDKWETFRFFSQIGLPTCESWLPDQIITSKLQYPLFIKPRFGSASNDTFKVTNRTEFDFFLGYVANPIVQEFLPGPEITNDVICDLEGEILGISSRQRIEVRWGEVAKGVTVKNTNVIDGCVKIAKAFGAVGPITVQCMMKDGLPKFTEINARFGGGIPLGIKAGVDAPKWLLARLANIDIKLPPLGSFMAGLHISRYDDSFFLTDADRDRIKRCNI